MKIENINIKNDSMTECNNNDVIMGRWTNNKHKQLSFRDFPTRLWQPPPPLSPPPSAPQTASQAILSRQRPTAADGGRGKDGPKKRPKKKGGRPGPPFIGSPM